MCIRDRWQLIFSVCLAHKACERVSRSADCLFKSCVRGHLWQRKEETEEPADRHLVLYWLMSMRLPITPLASRRSTPPHNARVYIYCKHPADNTKICYIRYTHEHNASVPVFLFYTYLQFLFPFLEVSDFILFDSIGCYTILSFTFSSTFVLNLCSIHIVFMLQMCIRDRGTIEQVGGQKPRGDEENMWGRSCRVLELELV